MAFTEDLAAFLDPEDFAVDCTVGGEALRGIFDNAHALAAVGEVGMASSLARLTVASADLPASPLGTAVTVDGQADDFTVVEVQPDGTGMTVLVLELAP